MGDGREALDFVQQNKPDVVLMDIQMPGLDGFETTRQIMETEPLPIIICSAATEMKEMVTTFRVMEAGAVAYVEKPVSRAHPQFDALATELVQTVKLMSEVKVVRRWKRVKKTPLFEEGRKPFDEAPPVGGDRRFHGRPAGVADHSGRIRPSFRSPSWGDDHQDGERKILGQSRQNGLQGTGGPPVEAPIPTNQGVLVEGLSPFLEEQFLHPLPAPDTLTSDISFTVCTSSVARASNWGCARDTGFSTQATAPVSHDTKGSDHFLHLRSRRSR
ncbi:MAG: response regulator [Chthoniobacteraceae bacterium]